MCWINGRVMPLEQARIPVTDHGLLYGDGVFEGIRFYFGRAFRLAEHLQRLRRSAAALQLRIPFDADALRAAVDASIAAFGQPDGYLRLVVTRGTGKLGLDPRSCLQPNVFIVVDDLAMVSTEARQCGARVVVAAMRRLPPDGLDPRIKSLNYLNAVLARMDASNAGADEAILLNAQGRVTEGAAENVFIVRDGILLTPPTSDGALEGITRAAIIELSHAIGVDCLETSLAPYDLYTADECFLTGTGAELIPVREVDGRTMTTCPGPLFRRLQDAFRALVARECVA